MSTESPTATSSQTHKGVLLVRLCNWVGEAVLSLPALRRLDAAGYELHLYGKAWAPALFESTGWPVTVRADSFEAATAQLRGQSRALEARGRPPALLMTNSFSSALETRLAGFAPSGYAHEGRSLLLRAAYRQPRFTHAAHAYWHVAGSYLGTDEKFPAKIDWAPSDAQRIQARALLAQHGLDSRSFVMLCPFSGPDDRNNQKVWPGFEELARVLQTAGLEVVLCPGPGEFESAAAKFSSAINLRDVDLGVYGALFQLARCVVANDTGPGHLAAAASARFISIYGPHSVAAWTPIGPHVRLFHDAASWPTVNEVAQAALAS